MSGRLFILGELQTLLYIHTKPNIYYSTTCMLLYPHLMAKRVLELNLSKKPADKWCRSVGVSYIPDINKYAVSRDNNFIS